MPDKAAPNLGDPLQVAVKVTAIEGQLAMLQQQVSGGLTNVSTQLAALQGEQRDMSKSLREVAITQHDMQAHSEGLERLARAIDRNSAEFSAWREKHEGENTKVSERVTTFKGMMVGFGIIASVLAAAMVYIVQSGFERQDENLRSHIQTGADSKNELIMRITRNEKEIEKLREMRGVR